MQHVGVPAIDMSFDGGKQIKHIPGFFIIIIIIHPFPDFLLKIIEEMLKLLTHLYEDTYIVFLYMHIYI